MVDKETLKEQLLDELLDEGVIDVPCLMQENRGYHCSSCSCYRCKNAEEDCVCTNNAIIRAVEKVLGDPAP